MVFGKNMNGRIKRKILVLLLSFILLFVAAAVSSAQEHCQQEEDPDDYDSIGDSDEDEAALVCAVQLGDPDDLE